MDVELDDVVVRDTCDYGIMQIDTMNVYMLVDPNERIDWKSFLKDKWVKKVRVSDGFVAFSGQVKEIRMDQTDEFNLLMKVKAHTFVLNELTIEDYADNIVRTPDSKITGVSGASVTFSTSDIQYGARPSPYTDGDHAIMIVPSEAAAFSVDENDSIIPTNSSASGDPAFLDQPLEYNTYVKVLADGSQTTFNIEVS